MDVGQDTTVTMVGFSGAIAAIAMWLLSFFAPDLMMTAPPGLEAAVTTVIVGIICYVTPLWKLGSKSS